AGRHGFAGISPASAKRRTERALGGLGVGKLARDFSLRGRRCIRCGLSRLSLGGAPRMPMHNPPHPGGIIRRQCLEPLGLSVTEAAKGLGITRQALSDLLNGKAGVSVDMAIRLSKAFGSSAETWLGLQTAHDLAQARDRARTIKVPA